jgi:ATP-binding cassette, subfamily B, bacterial CvaB/MchF/RaxB
MSAVSQFLNFSGRARLPVILQTEVAECGLACLAMIAAFHGHEFDLNTLRRRFPISAKGVTLRALVDVASRLDFSSRALRLEPVHLKQVRLPAILHWDLNHFVVLKSVGRSKVTIHDPSSGVRSYNFDELSKHMTGVALELTPTPKFERKREVARVPMGALIGRVAEFGRAIGQALILSVIVQLFVLISPFYMQIVVDDAVSKGDSGLLVALAIGFGLFMLINVAATALRSFVSLQLGNVISFQMVVGLFHHLMRLPLPYFERRHIGDLISRFSATHPIKDLITEGLVAVLVDGFMAVATLALMAIYSWVLALISLAAIIAYVALRLAAMGALRRRTEDQIQARAREDSTFIETVRAVQTIKLFGREAEREGLWQNRHAAFVNAGIKLGRLQIKFKAANDLIFGIETVAVIYVGARFAIDGALTIGMLFAYMSYKQQFLDKMARLIEKIIDLRMLDLYLERLGDIALAERERGLDAPAHSARSLAGAIELRGVSFRYAETEPYVLENATLRIEPGQFIAITGPSGGGKTTLMKLMLGLFEPASGEILIDGNTIGALGVGTLRDQTGVVMQDDQLLSGSINENISFFDSVIDHDWVQRCAEAAGIHDDIMRMPMGYHTLVGDMGGALSGGQRQRILLARALYRKPRILFLDEGTSHLDPAMEERINVEISKLAITRVIIAHRPQTVAAAERILVVHQGGVSEIMRPAAAFTEIPQARLEQRTKTRSQLLSDQADEQRRRCRDWLLQFMQRNQPKFLTKQELRNAAMRELNVSKLSFDMGWIMAIEHSGRHDWYEPLRRRLRIKS